MRGIVQGISTKECIENIYIGISLSTCDIREMKFSVAGGASDPGPRIIHRGDSLPRCQRIPRERVEKSKESALRRTASNQSSVYVCVV